MTELKTHDLPGLDQPSGRSLSNNSDNSGKEQNDVFNCFWRVDLLIYAEIWWFIMNYDELSGIHQIKSKNYQKQFKMNHI